jgi:hypothetical protein
MYRDGYALNEKELKAFLERCKAQNLDPNQWVRLPISGCFFQHCRHFEAE